MSKGGRYARKKVKKPLGGVKIALIVVAVILVLILALVIAAVSYYNSMLDLLQRPGEVSMPSMSDEELEAMLNNTVGLETTEATTEATTVPTTEATEPYEGQSPEEYITNIMLIGQAARQGEDYRISDTMMLCSINRKEKTLTLTSFQRDMRVVIPAYAGHTQGFNRMNFVYHLGSYYTGEVIGSMEMMALCMEQNFGIKVDNTIEVDFEMFETVVNLLGGVDMEVTQAEINYLQKNYDYFDDFTEGVNHLDGYQALCYARIRKIDSDFNRTNRQRNLIMELLKKCIKLGVTELNGMMKEVLPMVTTDMSNEEITAYALEFIPMLSELEVKSQSVPFDGTWWSTDIGTEEQPNYVIDCNLDKNKQMLLESIGMVETTEAE